MAFCCSVHLKFCPMSVALGNRLAVGGMVGGTADAIDCALFWLITSAAMTSTRIRTGITVLHFNGYLGAGLEGSILVGSGWGLFLRLSRSSGGGTGFWLCRSGVMSLTICSHSPSFS